MGTRNLTCVQVDGQYKIAQYGQWDGYPSGQGTDLLQILKEVNLDRLREASRHCSFLSKEELSALDSTDWMKTHPQLSRDHAAKIVKLVYEKDGLVLQDQISFAADSLFCEWAYVVDLDKNVLEVYKGFNQLHPPTEDERFHFLKEKCDPGYYPVKLLATFDLTHLPDDTQFLDHFSALSLEEE